MVKPNFILHRAKFCKNDEFYTRLEDIEKEMIHYKEHFKNAIIYCNCDNPRYSNFWKYFHLNFKQLKLKKLISTHISSKSYVMEYTGGNDDNISSGKITLLKGNGDFRSEERIELLKQSDIVVTNPPFSLFREFVSFLVKHNKKFLILGNQNMSATKEIFPFIMKNEIRYGVSIRKGGMNFYIRDDMVCSSNKMLLDDNKYGVSLGCVRWFTNLEHGFVPKLLPLVKKYNSKDYPTYDNYNAIEVNKTKNIPYDYDGIMGVPITFLDKWNPEQFEILGLCENRDLYGLKSHVYSTEECQNKYLELFGKQGRYDLNASGVVNGKLVYKRVLIRKKPNGFSI